MTIHVYDRNIQSFVATELIGINLNNPGYIEDIEFAKLQVGYLGSTNHFAEFDTEENGIRAAGKYLFYLYGLGLNTITKLISDESLGWYRANLGNSTSNINRLIGRLSSACRVGADATIPDPNIDGDFTASFLSELFYFFNNDSSLPYTSDQVTNPIEDMIGGGLNLKSLEGIMGKLQGLLKNPITDALKNFNHFNFDKKGHVYWTEEDNEDVDPDKYYKKHGTKGADQRQSQERNKEDAFKKLYGELIPPQLANLAGGRNALPAPLNWQNPDDPRREVITKVDGKQYYAPDKAEKYLTPASYVQPDLTRQNSNDGPCAVGSGGSSSGGGQSVDNIENEDNKWKPGLVLSTNFLIEDTTVGRVNPALSSKKMPALPAQFTGTDDDIKNLKTTARTILEPAHDAFGNALIIRRVYADGSLTGLHLLDDSYYHGKSAQIQVINYERNMTGPLLKLTGKDGPINKENNPKVLSRRTVTNKDGKQIDLVTLQTPNGQTYEVNAKYAANFNGFVNDLSASGYKITSIGGYENRNIAGGGTSNHAYGAAVDINPGSNPMSSTFKTDMPSNVSSMASKWGLGWGGNWQGTKDTMHFSASTGEGGTADVKGLGNAKDVNGQTINGNSSGMSGGIQLHFAPNDGGQQDSYIAMGPTLESGTYIRGEKVGPLPQSIDDGNVYIAKAVGGGN